MTSRYVFLLRSIIAVVLLVGAFGSSRVHADDPAPDALPLVSEAAQEPKKTPTPQPFVPMPFPFPTPVPKPKPQKADASRLLSILSNERACKTPLDLTVQNATLEQIAARIQKTLPRPAPKIKVQGALPIRLSFALKNSTVGEALSAAGSLAGVKLWVFADHLLLAPGSSLGTGVGEAAGEWSPTTGWNPSLAASSNEIQRVFSTLLADELSAKAATNAGETKAKTTVGALSPDSQRMLQLLVEQTNGLLSFRHAGTPNATTASQMISKISTDMVVEFDPMGWGAKSNGQPASMLRVGSANPAAQWSMEWEINGNLSGWRGPFVDIEIKGTPVSPPSLERSANKS